MEPLKRIRELLNHAKAMAQLLRSSRDPWWSELDEDPKVAIHAAARRVLTRDSEPYMRAGYVLREWLAATQQAEETLQASEQLWPSLRDRTHGLRSTLHMLRSELFVMRRAPNGRRAAEVLLIAAGAPTLPAIAHAFETEQSQFEHYDSHDAEGVFDDFCRYRERQSLASTARAAGTDLTFSIEDPREQLTELDDRSYALLQRALREYRANNLLFSWIRYDQGGGPADRYPSLFPAQNANEFRGQREMTSVRYIDEIRQMLPESQLPREEIDNAIAIISRLDQALREIDYPSLVRSVGAVGGQDGPQSMIGNQSPINLIPGGKKGACCPIVLALAVGRSKRSAKGWPGVLKRLKAHLTECSRVTRLAIVVADTWDSAEFFTDHFAELRAHDKSGVRFLFLVAGAVPMTLSPISIDFAGFR